MTQLLNGSLPQSIAGLPADSAAQGARRATVDAESAASTSTAPDPEVAAIARRRQFSSAEKRRILSAADHCKKPGELGALLRKEGIYSSMLANWRKQRTRGEFRSAAATPKRGRKPDPTLAAAQKNQQLQRENDRLRRRLAQAQEIIEVQKKLCTLLGLPTAEAPQETD
jgi:transposase-like protein